MMEESWKKEFSVKSSACSPLHQETIFEELLGDNIRIGIQERKTGKAEINSLLPFERRDCGVSLLKPQSAMESCLISQGGF